MPSLLRSLSRRPARIDYHRFVVQRISERVGDKSEMTLEHPYTDERMSILVDRKPRSVDIFLLTLTRSLRIAPHPDPMVERVLYQIDIESRWATVTHLCLPFYEYSDIDDDDWQERAVTITRLMTDEDYFRIVKALRWIHLPAYDSWT